MFLGIAAIVLVLIVWFCFSAGLVLLGTAGLIAYFITRAVSAGKGKQSRRQCGLSCRLSCLCWA